MLCASEWVAVAWSKVSFAFSVFVMLWEGCSIQVGWVVTNIVCVVRGSSGIPLCGGSNLLASFQGQISCPQSHACGGQETKSSYKSVI